MRRALLLIVGCSPASAPSGSTATRGSERGYDPGAHTCRFTGPDARRIARAPRSRDQRHQGSGWPAMRRGDRRDALPHAGRWQRRAPDPGDARWRPAASGLLPRREAPCRRSPGERAGGRRPLDRRQRRNRPKRIETTCPIDDCLGIWEPAWSPDDTQLAAVIFGGPLESDGPASFGVVIVDIATGKTRSVVAATIRRGPDPVPPLVARRQLALRSGTRATRRRRGSWVPTARDSGR